MLEELGSRIGAVQSSGEQCGGRWQHLSSPGFYTEPHSHSQLLIFLSAWRVNKCLKLNMPN